MTETENLPCPGCHTPLPLEATGCQICMRPRTRQEIMRGYNKLREEKTRRRRLPFKIVGVLLVLVAGAKLVSTNRERLSAAADAAGAAIGKWADDKRNPASYAGRKEEPASAEASAPGAPASPEAAAQTRRSGSSASPSARAPRPAAAPPAKNVWRVSGTVYDLETLAPMPGAEITFLHDGKEPVVVATDDQGAYEADLGKGDGWSVSMNAPNRRPGQILDVDPPYRIRDADERRAALEHITDGDLLPASVGWKRSESRPRLDLVAVAQNWISAPRR